jgi:glycosyltransferase involved in cell wall biosynthesis
LREKPDILFVMCGGGAKMVQLKIEVHRLQLSNFLFLPYQDREALGASLAAADVHLACLLPALEGLVVPSKFYGVLAAGRPIIFIGDPDGELARVIRSSGCGSTVATGDGTALAAELIRLKMAPDIRRSIGESSRRLFDDRYTLDIAARKWAAVLHDLQNSRDCHDTPAN